MNQEVNNDIHSLSHTKWNCKYHIVFAPKYRRKAFFEEKRLEVEAILRELCKWKGVNIITAEVCPNHVLSCGDTAKDKYIKLHGISEREEQHDDIRKVGESENEVSK